MKRRWVVSLGVALGLWASNASAEEMRWRPAPAETPSATPQVIAATSDRAASITRSSSPAVPRSPAAALERPVPIAVAPQRPSVTAVSYSNPAPIIRCQDPGPPAVPPPGIPLLPGGDDRYNCGVVPGPPPAGGGDPFLGGRVGPLLSDPTPGRTWFQSDHCFDSFISPVSSPFFAEDPRSLTEVRPIFMYQAVPNRNPAFTGGSIEYFGAQVRVAITDRWSIVMQKLGGLATQPDNPFLNNETGFSEVWLGPKFTFLRSESTGTLGAVGLTFQIPVGNDRVFQNTGTLSLAPYVSMAQTFGKSSYGAFNAMGTLGYTFATEKERTDYLYANLHLDYDIANLHKIYPLIELNWQHYTKNGNQRALDFEGGDLANLGSNNVRGNDLMSLAFGARYKFTECVQVGTAFEIPVVGRKDLMDFRWTVDLIFRY